MECFGNPSFIPKVILPRLPTLSEQINQAASPFICLSLRPGFGGLLLRFTVLFPSGEEESGYRKKTLHTPAGSRKLSYNRGKVKDTTSYADFTRKVEGAVFIRERGALTPPLTLNQIVNVQPNPVVLTSGPGEPQPHLNISDRFRQTR